ncbi:MAG TPA: TonB-dependent receptor [Nitrospiraceae bacterium]|nr:TonB-dependent receptor [Nitrospiraceae bacterium]
MNGSISDTRHPTPYPRRVESKLLLHRRTVILTLFVSAVILTVTPLQVPAQVADEIQLLKEEEMVSIATRNEQPISEAPSNVYVITDEDIRQSGAIDIPTLLRRIPGMEVMQTTGADFNVSVRGDNQLNANKLLVMVDGRSIYIDVQGIVFWKLLPVTLPEIKRIEVLKGPASAIYGFNAFDGIINIITKSPEEMRGTTVQFGGGEFGTITSAAVYANTVGKLGYRLSIGRDQNQQWRNSDALAFRAHKFNVQTDYALSEESRIRFSGGLVDANRFDGPITQDTVSSTKPAQGYAHLVYERPNFYVRGFWNRFDTSDAVSFNPLLAPFLTLSTRDGSPVVNAVADTYNLEGQHAIDLTSALRLTYGANYRHNTLSSNAIAAFSREDRMGFYGHMEWRMARAFTLVGGLRYDLDTFIKPTTSPRVALLYNLAPDHTIRLSGSVAYRPPTLFEKNQDERVVTNTPLPPLTTTIVGGANLSPEQIISYEAEYQGWYLKHRLRTRAALFYNHISDLISTRDLSPTIATPVNDPGSADIYGGEIGAEFLATKWLTGFANYSYQDIHQTFTGRVQRAGPHNKLNVGLRGEWENGLSAEAIYHYYGSVAYPAGQSFMNLAQNGLITPLDPRVGSYNLLNMRAGYRFWQQKAAAGYMRDAEVAVSVFNALNDEHKEHPLGDLISRRVMGWLTLRF